MGEGGGDRDMSALPFPLPCSRFLLSCAPPPPPRPLAPLIGGRGCAGPGEAEPRFLRGLQRGVRGCSPFSLHLRFRSR